jgi:P-type Cu+ transporter
MSQASASERLSLPIEGMTCSSCANRVEKRLNRIDGVEATVNFATEQATVEFDPGRVEAEELVAAVGETGYTATLPPPADAAGASAAA